MLRVFGERIVLATFEEDPLVAWFDHDPDGVYNDMDPSVAADEIEREARCFAQIVSERRSDDWARTARRGGPAIREQDVDRFTVAGLACFALHEAHHHRLDATRALPTP
jgi:hypothetical protein